MDPKLTNLCREEIALDRVIANLQRADLHLSDIRKGAVKASEGRMLYATKLRLAKRGLEELLELCKPEEAVEVVGEYVNRTYY